MKTLIVEDDFLCRMILQEILSNYGQTHIAINGKEAVEAVRMAIELGTPYNLICMDILMPEMDGQDALKGIRKLEEEMKLTNTAKVIMITAVMDPNQVFESYQNMCDGYLSKPVEKVKLLEELRVLGLIA